MIITPQITYRDESLKFHIAGEEPLEKHLDELDKLRFVEVNGIDTGTVITADIGQFITHDMYSERQYKELRIWLATIAGVLPFLPKEDEGIAVNHITEDGPVAHVFPSLQHWIQKGGFTPEIHDSTVHAMASVMGETNAEQLAEGHIDVRSGLWPAEFRLIRWRDIGDDTTEGKAKVLWQTPFLQTLGNCACMSSNASKRELFIDNRPELYAIEPHNIDELRPILSILVGLGAIASNLPSQFDEEAFWGSIEWQEQTVPRL